MGFYEILREGGYQDGRPAFDAARKGDVERAMVRERLGPADLAALLSPAAAGCLEEMAVRARELTIQRFGKVVLLYAPLYLSDYCDNHCLYCGFAEQNSFPRRRLALTEVAEQAEAIAATGMEHLLLLTGESRQLSPVAYLGDCLALLQNQFSSLSVEVYPLSEAEYADLVRVGLDGVTVYQEVYHEETYRRLHPAGPKKDYAYRLETPERVGRAGVRTLNIGALLGLHSWRHEVYWMARHAAWLQDRFPDVEVSVSVPRLQPHLGNFEPTAPVSDRELVQIILALRIYLPWAGITLSTRERPSLRDSLVGLGVTKMSAGSRTDVGGYTEGDGTPQFDIADERGVDEVRAMIAGKGYQPIFRDWL